MDIDDYPYSGTDETAIDVNVIFHKENTVNPVSFWLHNTEYIILSVIEQINGESLKNIGVGIRYKVRLIDNDKINESYLFRFKDKWYLAGEDDLVPDIQTRHKGDIISGKKIIDDRYNNLHKVAVDVAAICYHNWGVEPYAFWWDDGTKYEVDRILEQEHAASLKAGIVGLRYKIIVSGKETYLYRDDDLWFMERKGKYRVLDVHGRPL